MTATNRVRWDAVQPGDRIIVKGREWRVTRRSEGFFTMLPADDDAALATSGKPNLEAEVELIIEERDGRPAKWAAPAVEMLPGEVIASTDGRCGSCLHWTGVTDSQGGRRCTRIAAEGGSLFAWVSGGFLITNARFGCIEYENDTTAEEQT